MDQFAPPLDIPAADWEVTPLSVRLVVLALLEQVQTFQTRITDLEARLNLHSGNSLRPPSSDPPSAPPRPPASPSGRKRGAQSGHPRHHRDLLPPDQVSEFVVHVPPSCSHCQHALPPVLPTTGPVLRQQVWEVPPIEPTVTEHQFPTVTCPHCQKAVRAERPVEVPPGSVPTLYQSVSCAPAPVYSEVQQQTVANVDETPWRENRKRRYLWVAVTIVATVFMVARRSRAALEQILGAPFGGIVGSDRYNVKVG